VRAARLWPLKRLEALRKRAEQMGADVLGVESARGGGCTGRTATFYRKKEGKTKSRPMEGERLQG